jgi:hypothetical protein
MTAIAQDIESAEMFLLDVAPVERSYLDAALGRMLQATGNTALMEDTESAALAYARAVAERAYELGLDLGKQAGKMTGGARATGRVAP